MSKKTLNKNNLKALGAERLADLLLEVSTGSADIKRRLRLELSHNVGATELARDVRKRLVSLRKSTSFVGWRKRKSLIKDLNTQVDMITEKIAPEEPTEETSTVQTETEEPEEQTVIYDGQEITLEQFREIERMAAKMAKEAEAPLEVQEALDAVETVVEDVSIAKTEETGGAEEATKTIEFKEESSAQSEERSPEPAPDRHTDIGRAGSACGTARRTTARCPPNLDRVPGSPHR